MATLRTLWRRRYQRPPRSPVWRRSGQVLLLATIKAVEVSPDRVRLQLAGARDIHLDLGHVGIFRALAESAGPPLSSPAFCSSGTNT